MNDDTGEETPALRVGIVGWATVEDALYAAEILEAMAESARNRQWVTLDQ